MVQQPETTGYALFDATMKHAIAEQGIFLRTKPGEKLPESELDKSLQTEMQESRIKISDSWDAIADWIDVSPEALKSTADLYNKACDRGLDSTFYKDRKFLAPLRTAPFYAIKFHVGYLQTIGGIKINENMEVLDMQGKAIPGLYAAGSDTGGWETETYCSALSGTSLGFAVNSGRIAGENAVNYLSSAII
jgi:fumarate reductase flavoprotein subunit